VALSDQETGASKQLAAPLPYTHLLTAIMTAASFQLDAELTRRRVIAGR
jgi:hypothetical protein